MANGGIWNTQLELQRVDVVSHEMRVVIKRVPIRHPLQRYVPLRFTPNYKYHPPSAATDKEDALMSTSPHPNVLSETEDEQIQRVMTSAASFFDDVPIYGASAAVQKHPTEYNITVDGGIVPPSSYICRGCGKAGDHYRSMCTNPVVEQLDRIRAPHGIPKLFLESVVPGTTSSLQSFTGEFVQRTQPPLHAHAHAQPPLHAHAHTQPPLHAHAQPPQPAALEFSSTRSMAVVTKCDVHDKTQLETTNDNDTDIDGVADEVFVFDFESHISECDALEKQNDAVFYKKHPELLQKHGSLCSYYVRGLCQKTKLECKFLHMCDARLMPICQFFLANSCANDPCMFRHDVHALKQNVPCPQYKTGFCKKGPLCEMVHTREIPQNCLTFLGQVKFKLMIDALLKKEHQPFKQRRLQY